jgi:hypothetical protein
LASNTLSTDCSCSPSRYTRGFVCRSGRAGPAVAMAQDRTSLAFLDHVVGVNGM